MAEAVVMRRRGLVVAVSIADVGGRALAAGQNLDNTGTVTIVELAIRLGQITTRQQLTALWATLSRPSRLPKPAGTGLLDLLP